MRAWKETEHAAPYLTGRLEPLLGWLEAATAAELSALQGCCAVLADVPFAELEADPRIGGHLLGELYARPRTRGDTGCRAAFYTPAAVCALIAAVQQVPPRVTIAEPAAGTGAMLIAIARDTRSRGLDPGSCHWHIADADALAG